MKILLINHFPLEGSGSGTYTSNIAAYLAEHGHEVSVVMPENQTKYYSPEHVKIYPVFFSYNETIEGALDFNFPCFTSHPRSSKTFYDLTEEQLALYMNAFETAVNKAVCEIKPDVIHAQHLWLLSHLAVKTGIPCVITVHGTDLMGYKKSERFRSYAHEAAAGAQKIITISKDTDNLVKTTFPDCASKAVRMKNGYDPNVFSPQSVSKTKVLSDYDIYCNGRRIVLFAGKLTHFKGVDVLLEAAKLYENECDDIITLIAGDGELFGELMSHAKALKLRNVYFLNHVMQKQLSILYSIADVTVVPSRREPFGLVAVEALACGSPVVATNQGGLPDFINDSVGKLVDVDDAVGLSSAVIALLNDKNAGVKRLYAAKYALENFSQEKLIGGLVELYQSIV